MRDCCFRILFFFSRRVREIKAGEENSYLLYKFVRNTDIPFLCLPVEHFPLIKSDMLFRSLTIPVAKHSIGLISAEHILKIPRENYLSKNCVHLHEKCIRVCVKLGIPSVALFKVQVFNYFLITPRSLSRFPRRSCRFAKFVTRISRFPFVFISRGRPITVSLTAYLILRRLLNEGYRIAVAVN